MSYPMGRTGASVGPAGEEREELGEEPVRNFEMRDMPAVGNHHPRRAGNVTSGRGGKLREVTEPGGVLRRLTQTAAGAVLGRSTDGPSQ